APRPPGPAAPRLPGARRARVAAGKEPATLSEKTVKNALGSLRALLRAAAKDELLAVPVAALFDGLEGSEWEPEEPDPFTAAERDLILAHLERRGFHFHAGRAVGPRTLRLHPPFAGYVDVQLWHGLRPSEASGLQVRDLDPKAGVLYVRRSFHDGAYGRPKTKAARRTVELRPESVALYRDVVGVGAARERPLFPNLGGGPIEPKSFEPHYQRVLRALRIRQRGMYCMKDTFVTLAFATRAPGVVDWVSDMTGVAA